MAAEHLRDDGFYRWLGIAISHYRFRRGYVLQGQTLTICRTVQVSSHWGRSSHYSVSDYHFGPELRSVPERYHDWGGVAATYIGIPLFLIIWLAIS